MWRVISVNALVLLIGLVLVELMFGTWLSDRSALLEFSKPRNVRLETANRLPGQDDRIVYTRDAHGLRGLSGDLDKVFLLTVGGSTTDQRYLGDGYTWQDHLERLFAGQGRPVDIVNAGIDGQSTYGHISNFTEWFPFVPGLKPRYVLFFVGVNDFYDHRARPRFDEVGRKGLKRVEAWITSRSALYAGFMILKQSTWGRPRVRHFETPPPSQYDPASYTSERSVQDYRTPDVVRSLEMLRERLRQLATLTVQLGARPIFVTQRSSLWTMRDGKVVGVRQFVPDPNFSPALVSLPPMTGVDRHHLEMMQASLIMETCAATQSICIDLAREIEVDPARDYYDMVHSTPEGARQIATYLHAKLRDLP
jgi:hypothetical protein